MAPISNCLSSDLRYLDVFLSNRVPFSVGEHLPQVPHRRHVRQSTTGSGDRRPQVQLKEIPTLGGRNHDPTQPPPHICRTLKYPPTSVFKSSPEYHTSQSVRYRHHRHVHIHNLPAQSDRPPLLPITMSNISEESPSSRYATCNALNEA